MYYLVVIMQVIRAKIKNTFTFIFKNYTFRIIFSGLCISLIVALVHTVFRINIVMGVLGLTLFLSGAVLFFGNNIDI